MRVPINHKNQHVCVCVCVCVCFEELISRGFFTFVRALFIINLLNASVLFFCKILKLNQLFQSITALQTDTKTLTEAASDMAFIYTVCSYTVVANMIITLVFSAAKNFFKSVVSIFCCSVSVGNISLHFQTFIWPLIVIIQFCLTIASAPHRDLIWSSSVCLEWHEETEQTEKD